MSFFLVCVFECSDLNVRSPMLDMSFSIGSDTIAPESKKLLIVSSGDDELLLSTPKLQCKSEVSISQQEECDDMYGQVQAFLDQLATSERHQVVERLLRRLRMGEPLSARRVTDRVDESCEFLADLLAFCSDMRIAEAVLLTEEQRRDKIHQSNKPSPVPFDPSDQRFGSARLGDFLVSRRRHRLQPVRKIGPWEEHFTNDNVRYFFHTDLQRTQWEVPEGWTNQ